MPQKLPNVNCQCFKDGKCLHQAAPRAWFGPSACVLSQKSDPRITACALRYPYTRSDGKPLPPPGRFVTAGRNVEYLAPLQRSIGAGYQPFPQPGTPTAPPRRP